MLRPPARRKGREMGEKTILVCDVCGRPAAETVAIRAQRGNFVKDLCATHVNELVAGARKPRPGRRRGTMGEAPSATPKRRGRPPGPSRKAGGRKKTAARK